jgi:YD repeat-containing protein
MPGTDFQPSVSPGSYTYSLPGVNGTPVNYTFVWKNLGDAGVLTAAQPLQYTADSGRGRLSREQAAGVSQTAFDSYDEVGRPAQYHQAFWAGGAWGQPYNVGLSYDYAGHVLSETYPSGHTVSYNYDGMGRLDDFNGQSAFSGNLGDGVQRTYSTGVSYSEFSTISEEKFGTQTPLYHKLHYNVRGQLYDVRLSTVAWATDQWNWNRGALINYYSTADLTATNASRANSGPDNNGNLVRTDNWVPGNDAVTTYAYFRDNYSYDSLNRLTSVTEVPGSQAGQGAQSFAQGYSYDRWGNRTINAAGTSNAPAVQFDAGDLQNTNRLYAPGDTALAASQRRMQYDAAGNLTYDSYTGAGTRAYDAENRMTSAQDNYSGTTTYAYDASGHRVKRNIDGSEVWQIYGAAGSCWPSTSRARRPTSRRRSTATAQASCSPR